MDFVGFGADVPFVIMTGFHAEFIVKRLHWFDEGFGGALYGHHLIVDIVIGVEWINAPIVIPAGF